MGFARKTLFFAAAVAACGAGFLVLDVVMMNMQGLDLIFEK